MCFFFSESINNCDCQRFEVRMKIADEASAPECGTLGNARRLSTPVFMRIAKTQKEQANSHCQGFCGVLWRLAGIGSV